MPTVAPGQTWYQKGNREPLHVLGRGPRPDEWVVRTEGETFTLSTRDVHLGYVLAPHPATM